MRDGSVHEHYQKTRRGDPDMPLTDDELEDKFMELTGPVMGDKASIGLLDACRSLETLGSVRDLPKVGPLSAVQSAWIGPATGGLGWTST
jgi:hypothetical protein